MKRSTSDGYEAATFIVRLWRTDSTSWRGTAVHVQSGTERHVQTMETLIDFLQSWTESRAVKAATTDRPDQRLPG